MKTSLILLSILLISIIEIYSHPISQKLSSLLKNNKSEDLIKNINIILDKVYDDKKFIGFNLDLTESEQKTAKRNLLENYKKVYAEYYSHLKEIQTDEEIQDSLYNIISDILEFYAEFNSIDKPKMSLGKNSGVSIITIGKQHDGQLELEENINNEEELKKYEKKQNEASGSTNKNLKNKRSRIKEKNNYLNKIKNIIPNIGVTSFIQRISRKKKWIDMSLENVENYLIGNPQRYPTDILDYSSHPAFFPSIVFDQDYTGSCYSAAASMLFSYYINKIKSRNNLDILEYPIDYALVTNCASYQNTFPITPDERTDLQAFDYKRVFKNYILNRGSFIGVMGPTTVWIKHHLNTVLFAFTPDTLYQYIANYKHFGRNQYTQLCHQWKEEYPDFFEHFETQIFEIKEQLKEAKITPIESAFNNIESLKNRLLNHGPFGFRIALSKKGANLFRHLQNTDVIITREMCNRSFNIVTTGRHYILAVGFGIRNNRQYVKFKNSYGKNWGDNGYGYLEIDDAGLACNYKSASQTRIGSVAIE